MIWALGDQERCSMFVNPMISLPCHLFYFPGEFYLLVMLWPYHTKAHRERRALAPFYNSFSPYLLHYCSLLFWLQMFLNLTCSLLSSLKAAVLIPKVLGCTFHVRRAQYIFVKWVNEWMDYKMIQVVPSQHFRLKEVERSDLQESYPSVLLDGRE